MRTTEWTVKLRQAYLDVLEAAGGLEIAINKHAHHRRGQSAACAVGDDHMVPLVGLELEGQGHLCELWSHAAHHHPVACTHPSWLWSCVVIIIIIRTITITITIITVIINNNNNREIIIIMIIIRIIINFNNYNNKILILGNRFPAHDELGTAEQVLSIQSSLFCASLYGVLI